LTGQVRAALNSVKISRDGIDVLKTEFWVIQAQYTMMQEELAAALAFRSTLVLYQDDADAVRNSLQRMFDAFNPKPGLSTADKTALNEKIRETRIAMTGVIKSSNGSDVALEQRWVATAIYATLETALAAADIVAADYDAEAPVVAQALTNLSVALAAFVPAFGTLSNNYLQYTFTGPGDETINLGANMTLMWSTNTALSVTAPTGFDTYAWYLNGTFTGNTTRTFTGTARNFIPTTHELTVKVTRGDLTYSKTVFFTVE